MAGRVGIRELRQELSRALRRVRAGETLEVTDRGRTIARIVPVEGVSPKLADLIGAGKVRPPTVRGPLPAPLREQSRMTSEEAVDLLRDEDRPRPMD